MRGFLAGRNYETALFWAASFSAGVVAVGYSYAFRWVEAGYFAVVTANPWVAWFLSPACFAASLAMVRWGAPEAGGSGIPQVLAANDLVQERHKPFVDRLLSLKMAAIKIGSSLVCLAGGGAIGREGPTVQVSAAVFHYFRRFSRKIHPARDSKPWIVAGAAAGLASAFNTPLGGLVYAIEELGLTQFQTLRIPLLSAVIIAGLVSQWLYGNYLYFGYPRVEAWGFRFLPLAVWVGICGGLLGGMFGKALTYIVRATRQLEMGPRAVLVAALGGLWLAAVAAMDPRAAGSGKELVVGMLFQGHTGSPALVALRFCSTLVTYCSGVAGGIFAPSLAVGASLGSAMAGLFHSPHANLMVILGMIGFLTGVTGTPFTAFVLVLEMTNQHSSILPMMLAAVGASLAGHFIDPRSFYEVMRELYLRDAGKTEGA